MSDRPTPETDAQEFLKLRVENDHSWQAVADLEKMTELARELRDALALVVSWWEKADRGTDEIEESEVNAIATQSTAILTKAKEVLP